MYYVSYWWVVDDYIDMVTRRNRSDLRKQVAGMRPGAKPPWCFKTELEAVTFMVGRARRRVEELQAKLKSDKKRAWRCERRYMALLKAAAERGEISAKKVVKGVKEAEPETDFTEGPEVANGG